MNWDRPPNREDELLADSTRLMFRYGLATAIYYVTRSIISHFANLSERSDELIQLVLTIAWGAFILPPSTFLRAWASLKLAWLRYIEKPLFYANNALTKLRRVIPVSAFLRFGKVIYSTAKQTVLQWRVQRQHYKYKPLQRPDEIRLLKLSRGLPFTQCSCELESFKPGDRPTYESISYTWGDPEKNRKISMDGCVMNVTQNVHDVLQDRRSFWMNRWIWIDAICINQADLEEKSEQVRRMQSIYRSASRVIVWLGQSDDAQVAIDFIMELWNEVLKFSKHPDPASQITAFATEVGKAENTKKLSAVLNLFRQPWFNRIWVIQEVVVTVPVHVVYSGRYLSFEILMQIIEIFATPEMLTILPSGPFPLKRQPMPNSFESGRHMLQLRMDHVLGKPILLEDVITACSRYQATDPRDKVFALVGMASDALDESIQPDYHKSVSEVYISMAKYLLTRNYLVRTLPEAGIGHVRKITDIPSWIPDWSSPPKVYRLSNIPNSKQADYSSSGQTQAHIQLHEESNMITVRGICVDQIAKLAPVLADTMSSETELEVLYSDMSRIRAWHQELLDIARSGTTDTYKNGQTRQEAFWRTLIGDRTAEGQPAPEIYAECYQHWVQILDCPVQQLMKGVRDLQISMLQAIFIRKGFISRDDFQQRLHDEMHERARVLGVDLEFGGEIFSRNVSAFQISRGQHSYRRRFAVTRNGYMALVPPGSEEGDAICILFGAQTPSVLRRFRAHNIPKEERKGGTNEGEESMNEGEESTNDGQESTNEGEESNLYNFVGECYVHGVMDGELIDVDCNAKSKEFILR
jgi:hypothetical protein